MFMPERMSSIVACRSHLYVSRFAFPILLRQTGLFEGKKGHAEINEFL